MMFLATKQHSRVGGIGLIGVVLLITGSATPIRSAEDVTISPTADAAEIPSVATGACESVDQVADEILQLREAIGTAWREDAVVGSAPLSDTIESDVIRTALIDQTRARAEESPPPERHSVFDQQTTLREAAHQLDLTAHALECQELYSQADEVRGVAQRLRRQAREEPVPTLRLNGTHFAPVDENPTD